MATPQHDAKWLDYPNLQLLCLDTTRTQVPFCQIEPNMSALRDRGTVRLHDVGLGNVCYTLSQLCRLESVLGHRNQSRYNRLRLVAAVEPCFGSDSASPAGIR
jgi:hypothetical protein